MLQNLKIPVLLVDDLPQNLLALRSVLSTAYEVFEASSGAEALALVQRQSFSVILLDVQMPLMDGFETARRIRNLGSTPIIFVTANDREQNELKGYDAGAVDYLMKPVDVEVVKAKVAFFAELYRESQAKTERETQLRESQRRLLEERFNSIINNAPIVVWSTDLNGIYTSSEGKGLRHLGLAPGDLVGRSHIEMNQSFPGANEAVARALAGETFTEELFVQSRWYRTHYAPTFDSRGAITGMVGISSDITERKMAEDQARDFGNRLRLVTDALPVLILYIDADLKFRFANAEFERWFGIQASAVEGRTVSEVMGAEYFESRRPYVDEVLAGRSVTFEVSSRHRDGSLREVSLTYVPDLGPDSKVRGFVALLQDISERKKRSDRQSFLSEASRELSASLDYRESIQKVSDLLVPKWGDWSAIEILDLKGGLESQARTFSAPMSAQGAEMLERYPARAYSHTVTRQVMDSGKSILLSQIKPQILEEIAIDAEHLAFLKRQNFQSAVVVPIAARGRMFGALRLVSTRSDLRYTQADLEFAEEVGRRIGVAVDTAKLFESEQQAVAIREEFLSVASHELKTPLTALQLQMALQSRKIEKRDPTLYSPANIEKLLSNSQRSLARLSRLVEDMLDVSRIAHGRFSLSLETVDLNELVREVLDRVVSQMPELGDLCRPHFDVPTLTKVDRFRAEQVIINLVSNALKYGQGKPFEVRLLKDDAYAVISVEDHGIGIAPEDQERIFKRFERAVPSSNISGLGLGLYISNQIMKAHQGRILVESRYGEGSTFRAAFPIVSP